MLLYWNILVLQNEYNNNTNLSEFIIRDYFIDVMLAY